MRFNPFVKLRDSEGNTLAVYEIVAYVNPASGRWYDSRRREDYAMPYTRNPDRDAEIVMMRNAGMTHAEIGRQYGITKQRVSQILGRRRSGTNGNIPTKPCGFCDKPIPANSAMGYCQECDMEML